MIEDKIVSNLKVIPLDSLKNILKKTAIVGGISFALTYPIIPFISYFFPKTMEKIIFGCFMLKADDLTKPEKNGIKSKGRNFYLKNKNGSHFGLYHIFPMSSTFSADKSKNIKENSEDALKSLTDPIILYCHGIIGDRARKDRVNFYNVVTSWNYHVITLDYFGFGDSDGVASEKSSVESIILASEYLYSLVGSNFFVWGHSYGSSVVLHALNVLESKGIVPLGCFLESPFNNLYDAIKLDWKYVIYSWIPYIDNVLFKPLIRNDLILNSSHYIQKVKCPIQIFHSNDDLVVSKELCNDLYQHAKDANRDIEIKIFDESLGHETIYKAKDLGELIAKFETKCLNKKVNHNK